MRKCRCHLLPLHTAGLFLGHTTEMELAGAWVRWCSSDLFCHQLSLTSAVLCWLFRGVLRVVLTSSLHLGWLFSDPSSSLFSNRAGVRLNPSYCNLRWSCKGFSVIFGVSVCALPGEMSLLLRAHKSYTNLLIFLLCLWRFVFNMFCCSRCWNFGIAAFMLERAQTFVSLILFQDNFW